MSHPINPGSFKELNDVTVKRTITVTEDFGGPIEIQAGWHGTIVSDANTPEPLPVWPTPWRSTPEEILKGVKWIAEAPKTRP